MMGLADNRTTAILAGVLLAQLGLAAVMLMPRDLDVDPLATYDVALADRIVLSSGEDAPIELVFDEEDWFLADGLRADTSRLDTLLEVIGSDRWSWPVASTSSAAERFEVTEDAFQRRVALYSQGDELATLYLGTSPSFRRIHAREADSDKIYAIELATYDLPMARDDWLDKSILQPTGSIDSMTRIGEWSAALEGEGNWQFVDPEVNANASELSSMATRFETLRVMGLGEQAPEAGPDLQFEVAAAGETIGYAFYRPPEEEGDEESDESTEAETPEFDTELRDTLVKSSLRDEFFRVSSFTVDQLAKPLEELVQEDAK